MITKPEDNCARQDGRAEMVNQLYAENVSAVRRYVFSICGGRQEADDIVQETYLTALRKAAQFKPGTRFLSWVFQIARFKSMEQNRANSKAPVCLSMEALEALEGEAEDNPFFGAEELQSRKVEALRKCREFVTGRNLEFLCLRYEKGLKPARIAEEFGLKPETVHVALSKTRAFLKKCMETNIGKKILK